MSLRGNTKSDQMATGIVSTNQGVTGSATAYQAVRGNGIRLPEKGDKGDPGADGGYYAPSVEQVDETTMKISFVASKPGMETVAYKNIKLPTGVVTDEQVAAAVEAYMEGHQTSSATIGVVTLLSSAWQGAESPYSQVVEIDGVTENSQVDLTPSVEQLAIFHNKDLAFVTENVDGVVTVYALGDKPTNDYTIQVTITEVYV